MKLEMWMILDRFQNFGTKTHNWRLESNIYWKSLNITYLDIIEIFNKLFKKLNIIELCNFIATPYTILYTLQIHKQGWLNW